MVSGNFSTPLPHYLTMDCDTVREVLSARIDGEDQRLVLSGTRVRELLTAGDAPPVEFSRPEVAAILIAAYREAASHGA